MTQPSALAWILGALFLAACAGALVSDQPARAGAALELQSGPVSVAFGGDEGPLALRAAPCLRQGCPILSVRFARSASAFQGAPGEAGRVQHMRPILLEGGRVTAEPARQVLGQERSMGEAARAQGPKG